MVVLRRLVHGRVRLKNSDRLFFIQLYRWFPSVLKVITVIRPETLVRWHRTGFRRYWRWKSRSLGGRPQIDTELRALIRQMSIENPLWGAQRVGVEPTKDRFAASPGFEVRTPHQERFSSLSKFISTSYTVGVRNSASRPAFTRRKAPCRAVAP